MVLLALLVPAIDRAIYQAELAICGTNLRSIAGSATLYAAGNARRYPQRRTLEHSNNAPNKLSTGPFGNQNDIPFLSEFMPVNKFMNDPLLPRVNWEGSPHDTLNQADYLVWFGWQWRFDGPQKGMFKLGDRFTWSEEDGSGGKRVHSFAYLASDLDFVASAGSLIAAFASHPDHDGTMAEEVLQDEDVLQPTTGGTFRTTLSRYIVQNRADRGPIDANWARDDGSVDRLRDVEWDEGQQIDGRVIRVPWPNTAEDLARARPPVAEKLKQRHPAIICPT